MVFSTTIQPICLPSKSESSSEVIENWALRTQGWSPLEEDDLDSLVLSEIQIQVR